MSTFNRTIVMVKENGVLKRLPYDLIDYHAFAVSPAPVDFGLFDDIVATAEHSNEIDDFMYDGIEKNDPIVDIMYVTSEGEFTAMFDNVFAQYKTTDPSGEFGYPRL